jgi:hypothetical protein
MSQQRAVCARSAAVWRLLRALQSSQAASPPPRKPTQGAMNPAPAAPSPPPPGASVPRDSAPACAPREPVHTRQSLAGGLHPSARVAHRHAEPRRAAPNRRHTQARAVPYTSRADDQKVAVRACQDRAFQKRKHRAAPPRKGFPGRIEPCTRRSPVLPTPHQRASHAQQRARRQSQCTHANRSPEACTPPPRAVRRCADPGTAAPSRKAPQTRAGSRAAHLSPGALAA